jgi:uncharacterized coiled-coil protein SlyX
MIQKKQNNILLNLINENSSFTEIIPSYDSSIIPDYVLSLTSDGSLIWGKIPEPDLPEFPKIEIPDFEVIVDGRIKSTNIYYENGRVGISRPPLHTYKFDIAVPENTLMTAFHVGDGKYGFSMGNGTSQGFIPEIIGMGSDENDAGLYFLGKAGNNLGSGIPLIIMDGRSATNYPLKNRPIFGITSGDYNDYKLLVDGRGRVGIGKIPEIYKLEVQGSIQAEDVVIEGLSIKALIEVIKEHQEEIDRLNNKIELLQQKLDSK